jgi:perosamine synthetase
VRQTFLPYGRQEISDDDVDAVVEALRAELITQGPLIERFEDALAEYVGAQHVVAFANGTAALHGAAFAAELGPGDEVITSPLSFVASSNCVL